jgi:hypothetical protein
MGRETSRVSFLMCPFCVRGLVADVDNANGLHAAFARGITEIPETQRVDNGTRQCDRRRHG